jgi:hypothetical protein
VTLTTGGTGGRLLIVVRVDRNHANRKTGNEQLNRLLCLAAAMAALMPTSLAIAAPIDDAVSAMLNANEVVQAALYAGVCLHIDIGNEMDPNSSDGAEYERIKDKLAHAYAENGIRAMDKFCKSIPEAAK